MQRVASHQPSVGRVRHLPVMPEYVRDRIRTVIRTVRPEDGHVFDRDLPHVLADILSSGDPATCWFAIAVLRAEFPDVQQTEHITRTIRLDGADAALAVEFSALAETARHRAPRPVRVVDDAVIVDVAHTASVDFLSGIQRVVRETVRRWAADHPLTLVGWADEYVALRPLSTVETQRLLGPAAEPASHAPSEVLVPWRGVYVLPELAVEIERTRRLAGLTRFANTRVAAIGHDCIPVSSGVTVTPGMTSNFARFLAAMRYSDRIAVTSRASRGEFEGWLRMIRAAEHGGPALAEVGLPVQALTPSDADLAEARKRLCLPGTPLVLVVGSHEPRKNHLAVLHAAELLWREGLRFNLAVVGSGSWKAEPFRARVAELQAANRPLDSITALPDNLLWAAYRLARVVVFPSLNEGFGLPAAEALAAGTPVITSQFGSMEQIVAPNGSPVGGVLVDPRDDRSIAAALRDVLVDEALYRRLRDEARGRQLGSWDVYATASWQHLTSDGVV